MTAINHDEAARVAKKLLDANTIDDFESVRLVFSAYLEMRSKLEEYMRHGSADGRPIRQPLRNQLRAMLQNSPRTEPPTTPEVVANPPTQTE